MEVLSHRPGSGNAIPLIRQTFPGILTKIVDSATNGHHYIQLLLTFCHDLTNINIRGCKESKGWEAKIIDGTRKLCCA